MKEFTCTDNDYDLAFLLHQASHALNQAREKEVGQYGISSIEAAVMYIIQCIGDKPTPAEISRWIFRAPHTVISLLDRMEKKGLVVRRKNPERKNGWIVTLTEEGENTYLKSTKRDSIHAVMSSISENEKKLIKSCMRKLRDRAVKESLREPNMPFP